MKKLSLTLFIAASLSAAVQADTSTAVVRDGVLQWQNGEEIALFGVNYSAPFAYGYRALKRLNADIYKTIDMDVEHIARLGLDAYRIHLWDKQLADQAGNLLQNEHLALFDYLLLKLQQKNIKVIITPISWWGSGYPEPDPDEPGFAMGYSKSDMNQLPELISAQQNYLLQLMAHINPHTGQSYAADPNIIAFELFNEPKHSGSPQQSAAYVEKLIATLRDNGVTKPLFYNISEQGNDQGFATALCQSNIDGIAYQWYPTGLLKYSTLSANVLPQVANYTDPFRSITACNNKARMIYEFDAADVASSVMYPAMARSFRAAGFQWATQFAYDPAEIAHTNSDYNTHFLNLLYTPAKAISLKIAAEAFRVLPRNYSAPAYPANNQFAGINLNYHQNSSILNWEDKFFYSNSTTTLPLNLATLQHIAGVGQSAIVDYQGTGAYFLDKQAEGVWRLEVYPDVQQLQDPYQNASLQREVSRLYAGERQLTVKLPDLGNHYYLQGQNEGNSLQQQANDGLVKVKPGVYLLSKAPEQLAAQSNKINKAYYLPSTLQNDAEISVWHQPQRQVSVNAPVSFTAHVGANDTPESVQLLVRYLGHNGFTSLPMQAVGRSQYHATLPADWQRTGLLEYAISVTTKGETITFPGNTQGSPQNWDFVAAAPYWNLQLQATGTPIHLFDATADRQHNLYPKDARVQQHYVSSQDGKGLVLQLGLDNLQNSQSDWLLRSTLSKDNNLTIQDFSGYNTLAVKIRALPKAAKVELAILNGDGLAYGTELQPGTDWQYLLIPLSKLKATDTVTTQAYPTFMPSVLLPLLRGAPLPADTDLKQLQGIQLRFSSDAYSETDRQGWHGVELAEVSLIRR